MQEICLPGSEGGAKLSFVPTPIQSDSVGRLLKRLPPDQPGAKNGEAYRLLSRRDFKLDAVHVAQDENISERAHQRDRGDESRRR